MTGPFALAFTAGPVSAVNPCGFALLPAWIAYHLDSTTAAGRTGIAAQLGAGLALTAGYAGVLAAAGLLITAGVRALLSIAPWLALAIGGLLALAGAAAVLGWQIRLRLPAGLTAMGRRGAGGGRLVAFGAGYAIASLGCTVGLLLAVIAQALTTASLAGALAVFDLGATTLLLLLATGTALAGGALTRVLRRGLPLLHRATGLIMLAAGSYLFFCWLPATWGGVPGRGVPDLAPLASDAAEWLQEQQGLLAAIAGLVLVAAITAVAVRRRPRPEPTRGCCGTSTDPAATGQVGKARRTT